MEQKQIEYRKLRMKEILFEKRIGLYILMGSAIYLMTIKNRDEKGWNNISFNWLLIFLRIGPLLGIVWMISYMPNNLKTQIEILCETLQMDNQDFHQITLKNIEKQLFPNLNNQFQYLKFLKKYIQISIIIYSIGESISEISLLYGSTYINQSTNRKFLIILYILPYISCIIRSISIIYLCFCILWDIQKTNKRHIILSFCIGFITSFSLYIIIKYIMVYFILKKKNLLSNSNTFNPYGYIINIDLFQIYIYIELMVIFILLLSCILRNLSNNIASKASRYTPIVGCILIFISTLFRLGHIKYLDVLYYILYIEIGPITWGFFIFSHAISLYIKYDNNYTDEENYYLVNYERKKQ
ncbi:hypothetical protein ACR3K2_38890 [Cryptosporidium serpentis]